jgi:hypothetical protein
MAASRRIFGGITLVCRSRRRPSSRRTRWKRQLTAEPFHDLPSSFRSIGPEGYSTAHRSTIASARSLR